MRHKVYSLLVQQERQANLPIDESKILVTPSSDQHHRDNQSKSYSNMRGRGSTRGGRYSGGRGRNNRHEGAINQCNTAYDRPENASGSDIEASAPASHGLAFTPEQHQALLALLQGSSHLQSLTINQLTSQPNNLESVPNPTFNHSVDNGHTEYNSHSADSNSNETNHPTHSPTNETNHLHSGNCEPIPVRRSHRQVHPPNYLKDYHCNLLHHPDSAVASSSSTCKYPISSAISYDSFSSPHKHYMLNLSANPEPTSYEHAICDENWRTAINTELQALVSCAKTWELLLMFHRNSTLRMVGYHEVQQNVVIAADFCQNPLCNARWEELTLSANQALEPT
ncbi:hypothetical protein KIW84_054211 [Lathyrus oleraceus]|uniref:Uncharacterized protein n=1 Tax=Pisum sativum TaxID=3888 RepID=A0A9D4WV89_PEA|nr:hypothetical protein KIW84_054211 [Pisum sativum]